MNDPLWFTLADGPCSGLGSKTVLSEDGLCYRINLSPAEEVRPNNSPRLVLYLILFICPAESDFFIRLQIFLHAGCIFLHPVELSPQGKKFECGYRSRILNDF